MFYPYKQRKYFWADVVWVIMVGGWAILGALDAIVYYFMISSRFSSEIDMFNVGVIVGKVALVPLALYFNGLLLYENFYEALITAFKALL
mmetsp:Transcript_32175/g.49208  ORF Transcript_32175/g.49208 Transcript_32175/m.49208 type:complete len:90 (+) Transcript_32175:527-796(+)